MSQSPLQDCIAVTRVITGNIYRYLISFFYLFFIAEITCVRTIMCIYKLSNCWLNFMTDRGGLRVSCKYAFPLFWT